MLKTTLAAFGFVLFTVTATAKPVVLSKPVFCAEAEIFIQAQKDTGSVLIMKGEGVDGKPIALFKNLKDKRYAIFEILEGGVWCVLSVGKYKDNGVSI